MLQFIFVYYLLMLWIPQTVSPKDGMFSEKLIWKGCERKLLWSSMTYCLGSSLWAVRENMKALSQDCLSPGSDLNLGPFEYEEEMQPSRLQYLLPLQLNQM
jgi:hypothetical protein